MSKMLLTFNKMFTFPKIYFILVLCIFLRYSQQQVMDPAYTEKWNKYRAECATQEAIDPAQAKKAWDENKFPNDPKLKCYYKCVMSKLGVLDASGDVVDDELGTLAAQFNNASTKTEIVQECGPLKGADLCETAYKLMACIKAAILD